MLANDLQTVATALGRVQARLTLILPLTDGSALEELYVSFILSMFQGRDEGVEILLVVR